MNWSLILSYLVSWALVGMGVIAFLGGCAR